MQAVSLDLENDEIKLGLQIFAPSKSGEGKIGASADNAKIIESSGKTITEAVQNATLMQGKKIFPGHNRIIVISEEMAKEGLSQTLEFFSSNTFARKNVNVVISRGKAIDIIKTKLNQGMLPADILQKLITNANEIGYADNVLLYEFERSMKNNHDSDILPVVKMQEKKEEKQAKGKEGGSDKPEEAQKGADEIESVSSIMVDGCAIITKDGLIDILDKSESRGILWIRNAIDSTTVISSTDVFSICTTNISTIETKITPTITNDDIKFNINISCKGALGELHMKEGQTADTNDIKSIQKSAEQVIEEECQAAFERVIIKDKADVFNFGDIIWNHDVDVWKNFKDDWESYLDKIEIDVTVNVDIDSVGLQFNTKG